MKKAKLENTAVPFHEMIGHTIWDPLNGKYLWQNEAMKITGFLEINKNNR
jgi:hypothetical protein